jgi:hypothetical protein
MFVPERSQKERICVLNYPSDKGSKLRLVPRYRTRFYSATYRMDLQMLYICHQTYEMKMQQPETRYI